MSRLNRCVKVLEIEKTEEMIENGLKEFKEDKEDVLENKLRFLASENLFLERSNNIEKETKITRKYMKEIDAFKAKNNRYKIIDETNNKL